MPDNTSNSKDNIAPEEKLLRLIRKDKKTPPSNLPTENSHKQTNIISQEKVPPLESDKPKEGSLFFLIIEHINFSVINMLVTFVVIVAAAVFILNFLSQPGNKQAIFSSTISTLNTKLNSKQLIQERKILPLDYYQNVISGRVLFRTTANKEVVKETQLIPKSKTFSQLLQGLNLLGIMGGANPRAIIEDKKDGQTYFVSKGEVKVVDIESKKVTLEYQGETASLFL